MLRQREVEEIGAALIAAAFEHITQAAINEPDRWANLVILQEPYIQDNLAALRAAQYEVLAHILALSQPAANLQRQEELSASGRVLVAYQRQARILLDILAMVTDVEKLVLELAQTPREAMEQTLVDNILVKFGVLLHAIGAKDNPHSTAGLVSALWHILRPPSADDATALMPGQ